MATTTYYYQGGSPDQTTLQNEVDPTAAVERVSGGTINAITIDSANKSQLDLTMQGLGGEPFDPSTTSQAIRRVEGWAVNAPAANANITPGRFGGSLPTKAQVSRAGFATGIVLQFDPDSPPSAGSATAILQIDEVDTALFVSLTFAGVATGGGGSGTTTASGTVATYRMDMSTAPSVAVGSRLRIRLTTDLAWVAGGLVHVAIELAS